MRFCINFSCERLPVAYQMMFVSLIKRALEISDKEYFNSLYDFNGKKNKKIKDFTFSIKLSEFKLENDEFILADGFNFYFSSSNYETGLYAYNGILSLKSYEYNNYKIYRNNFYLVKEKIINSNEVIFSTASPLVVKNKTNKILDVEDRNFENELNYLAETVLSSLRGYGLRKSLEFENINLKRVVVKEEITEFTKNTGKKFYIINSLKGLFKLSGDKEDLNFLYKSGLSFRRGQGFGMLEVVGV